MADVAGRNISKTRIGSALCISLGERPSIVNLKILLNFVVLSGKLIYFWMLELLSLLVSVI